MLNKDQYSITYYIDHNDAYLKSLNIQNPNPLMYSTEDGLTATRHNSGWI